MTTGKTAAKPTLIERAAARYDFTALLRAVDPLPVAPEPEAADVATPVSAPSLSAGPADVAPIDRERLRDAGFIIPGAPPSALSEEFRLIKRQILLKAFGSPSTAPVDRGRLALICSAQPDEGKTFCAINLALSMASETDLEVLLIDADVAKPEIPATLGLAAREGLMDALADPAIDAEGLIVRTDIPNLSVLPAGRQTHNDTELLASARTRAVIDALVAVNPRRIVLFDSAPALAASPASVLAMHVGQVLLVVRADRTTEGELRDTLALVDACPVVQLMLNAVTFDGSNRKFGSYYGFGD